MEICCKNNRTSVQVDSHGGMLKIIFYRNGKEICPLFERTWGADADDFMQHLRGDFFATPFGAAPEDMSAFPEEWQCTGRTEADSYAHGQGAHICWKLIEQKTDSLCIEAVYTESAIEKVQRHISLCNDRWAVQIEDEIWMKQENYIPLGIHPMFALSSKTEKTYITPPNADTIWTYPVCPEESSVFKPNTETADLQHIPVLQGGYKDMSCLPLKENTENLLMLCNVCEGKFLLENREEEYTVELKWDKSILKHCMLWFSNRGRAYSPWNGENVCLGVEPITSAFDLGTSVSQSDNPLCKRGYMTAYHAGKGERIILKHEISLH